MKHFFRKTFILIFFYSAIFFVTFIGMAIINYFHMDESTVSGQTTVYDDSNDIINAVYVIVVLLFLDVWSVLEYWIESKKEEFFIRKMCGVVNGKLITILLGQFYLLLAISLVVGVLAALAVKNSNAYLKPFIEISLYKYLLIYGVVAIIGSLLNVFMMRKVFGFSIIDTRKN